MKRRDVLWLGGGLLAGCGGGGGGGVEAPIPPVGSAGEQPEPAPVPVAPAPPAPAPGVVPTPAPAAGGLSANIVMWGDSMVPAVAANLQALMPNRVVVDKGFLGQTATAIAGEQLADTSHPNWINVFWYGHNNELYPEATMAAIASSIAHLPPANDRFIILGVVNHANERGRAGTAGHAAVVRLNAELAARYPANFIDIRGWLLAHYNPNEPTEAADHANDVLASSLRYDEIHLRNEGSLLVAQRIKQFIDGKGW